MEANNDTQIQMNKIPAFTVIKNGSILKNIFLIRKQSAVDQSEQNQESSEQILFVGRHPNCHITLEHPSISRYHLRIHSNPSSQFLSVVDLSSVHGTWVSGTRIEPGVHVILKEGDTVKLGGSSRVYELQWVPLSQAYDVDERFVPAVYAIKGGGGEEEMNQDQKQEGYSSVEDLECSDLSSSNKTHDSPLKIGNENDDNFATVSIQALPVVSDTTSSTQVSDSLNDSKDQLMTNRSTSSCDDTEVEQSSPMKHEEYSLVDDLECSNVIADSPLKTMNPLTSGNENDDIFATVSIQAPLVSETTSATQVSDSLNNSEDQLKTNCLKSSCDDTEVEQSSPMKHEEYSLVDDLECSYLSTSNNIHDSTLKTLNPLTSGNGNDDIFATVSIQPQVVSETTSTTQVSDSLNDSEDQLMTNCLKFSCDDTEVEQSSPMKHEECSLVDDLECSYLSTANTIYDSTLKTLNPLTSGNGNDVIFATVSIQPQVVSETTSATQVSDSLNNSEFQLMLNCSKSSCEDTEVEQSSPWKKGNGNGELFTTVCIQAPLIASAAISETEMSDCLNKSEDKLNWLRDNLSNDIDQISYGTINDDLGSIDLFNAIETHEKDAINQDIPRSNETDIDIENQQRINNGSEDIRDVDREFEPMNQTIMMDESASMVLNDGVDTGVKFESVDHETIKKESNVVLLPDVADLDEDITYTPDISKAKEGHMNLPSAQNLSASMKLFDSLDGKEFEFYTPDKENKNPNACSGKSLLKRAVNSVVYGEKDIFRCSQNIFATDEGMYREQEKVDLFVTKSCEELMVISSEKESKSIQMIMEGSCNSINYCQTVQKVVNSFQNLAKKRWTMVLDTNSLLDHKSLKHLKLLEGIKGTQLFVPNFVIRELMDIKSQDNFFKISSKKASLALKWIDECMMNTRWWIRVDDETVHSSTAVPEVLEIALHLRKEISDQKIIILSDNLTLKIKSMANGIMCEAAEEFHESLVNPFSERFMWVGSLAIGLTWSCADDDIVRQKYHGSGLNELHRFKGLKLLAHVTSSQLVN